MLAHTETNERMAACFLRREATPDSRQLMELDLVRRVRSGNQEAFREMVERYQGKVFSIIHRILRNHQDAEDTAQVVFTKVYFALKDFDSRCSLFSWICKIAINECYTHLRKRRVRMAFEGQTPETEAFSGESRFGPSRQPSADITLAARDLLNKLLARVPEDDRMLLVLKEVEGHSIGELSEMTGAGESAIKTRLFRARQKLIEVAGRLSRRPVVEAARQPR
jgi:RNA polymerase sigma-70 factor, ECF subfamily